MLQALPLAVTMGAAIAFGEEVRWRRWAAIVVGFTGVLIIVRPGNDGFNAYALWALASVAFCTVRDLATKRLPETIPSLLVSTVTAALVMVCGAFLVGPMGGWSPVSLETLGAAGDGRGAASGRLPVHHHGDAHRRDLLRRAVPLHRAAVGDPARLPGFRRRARLPMIVGALIVVASGLYTLYRERVAGRGKPAAASTTPAMAPDGL